MNFLDLPEGESVFIDANVFVYAFAADPTLGASLPGPGRTDRAQGT